MKFNKLIAATKKNVIKSSLLLFLFSGTSFLSAVAQNRPVINIESAHNAIVLQPDTGNRLGIIYFGEKLRNATEYPAIPAMTKRQADVDYSGIFHSAYTPAGSRNLAEPAIQVTHADGNTSLDLQYVSHSSKKIDDNVSLTTVLLKDPVYPFEVTLYYKVYQKEDVVEQWSVIRHKEKSNVMLQKFASANLFFSSDQYWLRQYHGDWAREMQPEETRLTPGIKVLDSKLGTRENLYQPPSFMVSFNSPATEDEGKVLLGSVEWSGNFRVDLEVDPLNNLRLIAGMNNFASEYSLKPSEEFTTPAFLYTYSIKGKGEASRHLHDWAREYRILDGKGSRATLLNNWESTFFDFNE